MLLLAVTLPLRVNPVVELPSDKVFVIIVPLALISPLAVVGPYN